MSAQGLAVWDEELTSAERERVIEYVAEQVARRGMEIPAILFLETNKPLTFFASQGLIVLSPLMAPLVGFGNCRLAARVLEDRQNVERLIQRIEEKAVERQQRTGRQTKGAEGEAP